MVQALHHTAFFWEEEDYRTARVAEYLAEGLAAGQGVVAFTDGVHLDALRRQLGGQLQAAQANGTALFVDSGLAGVIQGGKPDRDRFFATVQGAATQVLGRAPSVRFYGDLVDRMCREGDLESALKLESWCNEILQGTGGQATVLCGYRAGTLPGPAAASVSAICAHHTGRPGVQRPQPRPPPNPPAWPHRVRFFEDEASRTACAGGFLAEGVRHGEAAFVVATREHLQGLARYRRPGAPWIEVDAHEALDDILVAGEPSPTRFARFMAGLEARLPEGQPRFRAYGEMVDILAQDGRWDAALALEAIWNGYGASRGFALLCGYSAHQLRSAPPQVRHACLEHLTVEATAAQHGPLRDLLDGTPAQLTLAGPA